MNALILAGRRDGRLDPLAAAAGVTHKCLVPVAGVPMLARVLQSLTASPDIGTIAISIDDASVLADLVAPFGSRVVVVEARANLVDSVVEAAAAVPPPLLITTADNVLLTPASIAEIVRGSAGAGAAAAFANKASVLEVHPDGQRRFYQFRDDAYSNCNTFVIGNVAALRAAEVFRGGGQFAKFPKRILAAFGLWNLIAFRFGWRTLDATFAAFGRRFGFELRAVRVSDGAAAIDVDNERTKAVAETILAAREAR